MPDPLYQRLKELDPTVFERFCYDLLLERHPGASILRVDGSAGDDGIDSFQGDFDDGPTIWQCKAFANGVHQSQHSQIKASLRRAIERCAPKLWILCLPVDLDARAHRWFQRLQRSYADRVTIGLLSAGQIVHELLHRRTLRERYFPGAVIDAALLRSTIARTGELSAEELVELTADTVVQYLQRLRDHDARFSYDITFSLDRGPQASHPRPGAIAAITDADKTITVFPRDHEALRVHPPTATVHFVGTGVEKFLDVMRTGRSHEFTSGEFGDFTSDLSFLLPTDLEGARLVITPSPNGTVIPMRVTFGTSPATVLEYVPFTFARAGTEECELQSDPALPVVVRFTVGTTRRGALQLQPKFAGIEVHEIQLYLQAIRALARDRHLTLYDLNKRATVAEWSLNGTTPPWLEAYESLIDDAITVADFYQVRLALPAKLAIDDLKTIWRLKGLMTGADFKIPGLTIHLRHTGEPNSPLLGALHEERSYYLEHPEFLTPQSLFGVAVPTGRVGFHFRARIKKPAMLRKTLERAREGDPYDLSLTMTAPVHAQVLRCSSAEHVGQAESCLPSTPTV